MNFLYPLLVVLLAVFAVAPLEYPGAFQSQTGLLAVYNLIHLDQNPLQFFNWAPMLGREYDLFRTDGALPYWIAEIFHRVGFSYLDSIKLVYALAWIVGGLAMFALARKLGVSAAEPLFSDAGALLAAMVYTYLPFHIATVYLRGAFAESVAWAVFPLALLVLVRPQTTDDRRQKPASDYLLSASPFAALVLIQPGMAILFALVAFAIVAALRLREREFTPTLATLLGGMLIGMLLYAPTIFRHGAILSRDVFVADFVLPFQLFSSAWGFPIGSGMPSATQTAQGTILPGSFSFQLGVVPVGLAIIAVAIGWRKGVQPNAPARRVVAVFLAAALVLTLLTFEISAPLWNVLGMFAASPWQLLAFVGLALSIVAGASVAFDARLSQPAMLAALVALPVVASYGYLSPHFLDFTPTRPQIAIFGRNEIALLDYRMVGPLRHGATVRLELRWQALRAVDHDYTVFVHAVDADGKTWGQEDAKPVDGTLPTIKWTTGQVVLDTHAIQIDVEGPREGYHLEVGLYQAATGDRAIIDNGADQLILPRPGDPEPTISDWLPKSN